MYQMLAIAIVVQNALISGIIAVHHDKIADLTSNGEIFSPGFPDRCCRPTSYTIKTAATTDVGYTRLTFTDIDLPVGSTLLIYEGEVADDSKLYKSQPEIRRRTWTRPSISASTPGASIHVVFSPANSTKVVEHHVGFRGHYWVTNSPPDHWRDKALEGVCKPIVHPLAGESISQKTFYYDDNYGTTVDCVWQLKVPHIIDEMLNEKNVKVYARLERLNFKGILDIREGVSSMGKMITSIDTSRDVRTIANVSQPEVGFSSNKGLYIHLTMINEGYGIVQFMYGLMHQQSNLLEKDEDGNPCSFGTWIDGFKCKTQTQEWCIPFKNTNNGVDNCPGGEDEFHNLDDFQPSGPIQDLPPSHKPSKGWPERACDPKDDKIMCRDVTCQDKDDGCIDNGGLACPKDGQLWCPSAGCVNQTQVPNYHYRCRKYCGRCDDGTCSLDGKCPGECPRFMRSCPDGKCMSFIDTCSGECAIFDQKCNDGSCKSILDGCPGDDCPGYAERWCDNKLQCYSRSDRCDGMSDCSDGTDEANCPTGGRSESTTRWLWFIMLPVTCIFVAVLACGQSKKENQSGRNEENTNTRSERIYQPPRSGPRGGFTGTRMTPVRPTLDDSSHTWSHTTTQAPPAPPDAIHAPTSPSGLEMPVDPPAYEEVAGEGAFTPIIATDGIQPPSYDSIKHSDT